MKNETDCVILHVEDDDSTAHLFQVALAEHGLKPDLVHVTTAEAAEEYLKGDTKPDLVVIDINLPGRDGFSLLEQFASDPAFGKTCFVVFTTSTLDIDHDRSLSLGARAFVSKENDFDDFVDAVGRVSNQIVR